MQLFLLGYIIIEICEIFTVGEFPLNATVRIVSVTSHRIKNPNTDSIYRHLRVFI
jgi:hypothetical protein